MTIDEFFDGLSDSELDRLLKEANYDLYKDAEYNITDSYTTMQFQDLDQEDVFVWRGSTWKKISDSRAVLITTIPQGRVHRNHFNNDTEVTKINGRDS
jgi:hypothetical protein